MLMQKFIALGVAIGTIYDSSIIKRRFIINGYYNQCIGIFTTWSVTYFPCLLGCLRIVCWLSVFVALFNNLKNYAFVLFPYFTSNDFLISYFYLMPHRYVIWPIKRYNQSSDHQIISWNVSEKDCKQLID